MRYKVNPLSLEELKLLAYERLRLEQPINVAPLSPTQAQCLVEDLAASKLELEIQNEHLNDVHAKLEQALCQWRDLFDFAPVGCISIDQARAITKSNLAAAEILGADRASLQQVQLDLYILEQDRAVLHALLSKAAQTREPQRGEVRILNESANAKYARIDVVSLISGPGYQVILSDNTIEKDLEDRLREREERWKFTLDTSADGMWDWHVSSGLVTYSDKLANLYGYSTDEFGGTLESWRARVHPDDQVALTTAMQRSITGDDTGFHSEFRMLCKDDTWKWVRCRGAVFSETSLGIAERVLGTHVDISASKATEASLRNALDTQKAAFDSIAHPIALLDCHGNVLHTNTAWKDYNYGIGFGRQLALSDILSVEMKGVLPDTPTEVQKQVVAGIRSVIDRSKAEFQIEYSHTSPNGERKILMEATPVVDGLARVLVSHHDITASLHLQGEPLDGARFYQVAQTEFIRATRYRQPLMVLVLTLNFGLPADKKVDVNTAAIVRDSVLQLSRDELRTCDIFGSIGSDSYAVLLPNTTQDGGEVLARRIIDRVLATPINMAGTHSPVTVTVSIGASILNGDASIADLLGRADNASRASRKSGGNCLTVDTTHIRCLWGDSNEGDGQLEELVVSTGLAAG